VLIAVSLMFTCQVSLHHAINYSGLLVYVPYVVDQLSRRYVYFGANRALLLCIQYSNIGLLAPLWRLIMESSRTTTVH
jgi:hypothetical protein